MRRILSLLMVFLLLVIVAEIWYYFSLTGKSISTPRNLLTPTPKLTHIEFSTEQKFDQSGRDLVYIKSIIQNRVDFTADLGWNSNANGLKRHFVGLFDSLKKVNGSYLMTLRHTSENNSQKEIFFIEANSGTYLSVLDLSDPQLKIYEIDRFDKLNLFQLDKILHINDIIHIAVVSENDKDDKIGLSTYDSMWVAEYVSIRRFAGLKQVLYELK